MVIKKKFILKNIVIPCILFIFAFLLTGYTAMTLHASFTVLPANHITDVTLHPTSGELYRGQTIKGSFIASENNLGSVAVALHNNHLGNVIDGRNIIVEDTIDFKLKEANQKEWYYENKYSGGQFHELEFFPFGFPLIEDSKNKKYLFEITSLNGNKTNYLTLTDAGTKLYTTYQFNKTKLLHDKNYLLAFLVRKELYAINFLDYYLTLLVNLIPFILYVLWLSPVGRTTDNLTIVFYKKIKKVFGKKYFRIIKKLLENVTLYELIILFGLAIDIIFIREINQINVILLISLWIFRTIIGRIKSDVSFFVALLLLIGCCLFSVFGQSIPATKTALWVFFFLTFGLFHSLYEMRKIKHE